MRIVVAPDKFTGTMTAVQAADAIVEGWLQEAAGDELIPVPMADGGPGTVAVVHARRDGQLLALTVQGPLGLPVPATVLLETSTGTPTAWVESAQACGVALLPRAGAWDAGSGAPDPGPEPGVAERASTYGVGQMIAAAVEAGARRVVVGAGGSGTNDGGAGMLAALGATAVPDGALTAGAAGLAAIDEADLAPARALVAGVDLVLASDVDNPLLGLRGATNVFGAQKGIADDRRIPVDGALTRWAHLAGREVADAKGAGAAGGLGYGLLLLGARREPGIGVLTEVVGLADAVAGADLVLTGEGSFDSQTRYGKVVAGVAAVAGAAGVPVVVVAGRVAVGAREMRAMGVQSAYAMVDVVGKDRAFADPAGSLARLAGRVARTWSPRRG